MYSECIYVCKYIAYISIYVCLITHILYTHLYTIKWGFIIAVMYVMYCQSCWVQFWAQMTGNHQVTSTFAVYSLTKSISTTVANKNQNWQHTKHLSANAAFHPILPFYVLPFKDMPQLMLLPHRVYLIHIVYWKEWH